MILLNHRRVHLTEYPSTISQNGRKRGVSEPEFQREYERASTGESITLNPLVLNSRSTPPHTTVLSLLVRTVTPRPTRINPKSHAPELRLLALQPPLASSHPRRLRLPTPVSEPNTEQIWVVSFLLLGNEAGWRRR
ncbi:hypothetical protein BJ165DRAFT_1532597 [Panaeolus papilionaceus]|nr:hypothetical protein BJ165DRAFT_1532597 [Panaeolus papilionaceus]